METKKSLDNVKSLTPFGASLADKIKLDDLINFPKKYKALEFIAKDVLTFSWQATAESKHVNIQAAQLVTFLVNWGDGTSEVFTGKGAVNIALSHTYAISGEYTVTIGGDGIAQIAEFVRIVRSDAFTYFDCSGSQVTKLNVSNCPVLQTLLCYNNQLQLSDLFAASQKISVQANKQLGTQNLSVQPVNIGQWIFSDQNKFNNIPTTFTVTKKRRPVLNRPDKPILFETVPAVLGTDYEINYNSIISFLVVGNYTVTMTNSSIVSHARFPAKVVVEITVKPARITFTWHTYGYCNITVGAEAGKAFTINWGDGTVETKTTTNSYKNIIISHTYAKKNEYTVVIESNYCCFIYLESCCNVDNELNNSYITKFDFSGCPAFSNHITCSREVIIT
jgi:Leucine-rich repeat (LRR) protein